ncbi:MAG: A/G-specific adenine glycosylase [Ancrocorticia sp.]|uniref:A/G-specific adenine glycosylase n=1 Tax=Ancrocorticia sp. TaxID=2593684 RepID=UPI003F9194C9
MFFTLIEWFARHGRPLPWREPGCSAWAILVCEVMSQQTPVSRVLPRWHMWMERWPEPKDLAAASPAEVLVAWDKLGYPRRALRLRECAIEVTTQHGGSLPRDRDGLLALPGIGPYTADAVIAFAYRERSTVLDTNIRRVLCRLNGTALPPATLRQAEIARAEALVPADGEEAAQWNAAIMELGALICTARNPQCGECPLAAECQWLKEGKPANAAPRKPQGFTGTHREARGKIMAVLRSAHAPVPREALHKNSGLTQARFDAALDSLIHDGLADLSAAGYELPAAEPAS